MLFQVENFRFKASTAIQQTHTVDLATAKEQLAALVRDIRESGLTHMDLAPIASNVGEGGGGCVCRGCIYAPFLESVTVSMHCLSVDVDSWTKVGLYLPTRCPLNSPICQLLPTMVRTQVQDTLRRLEADEEESRRRNERARMSALTRMHTRSITTQMSYASPALTPSYVSATSPKGQTYGNPVII